MSTQGVVIKNKHDLAEVIKRFESYRGSSIGTLAKRFHYATETQIEKAISIQTNSRQQAHRASALRGNFLGAILVESDVISSDQLSFLLMAQSGIPTVDIGEYVLQQQALDLVNASLARRMTLIPLQIMHDRLVVATHKRLDDQELRLLRAEAGLPIVQVITQSRMIVRLLDGAYTRLLDGDHKVQVEWSGARVYGKSEAVSMCYEIISRAIRAGATDIHFKPSHERVSIFQRVHGRMLAMFDLTQEAYKPVLSRLKVVAKMDISQRNIPQDGSTRMRFQDHWVELRLSVIPTVHGESVAIRLFDERTALPQLPALGLRDIDAKRLVHYIEGQSGLFLVTGPTGSGKSNTLYAMLHEAAKQPNHIVTVEDPVERKMPGIQQIQVNERQGNSMQNILRHLLRHDPDVVMVGEVRDRETASLVNRLSLSGHMALSTLHTQDAASAVRRMLDMGIAPYLLADTLRGVMAQRLVPVLCNHCKREQPIASENLARVVGLPYGAPICLSARGCSRCNGTGYSGRMLTYELLMVNSSISEAIAQNAQTSTIRRLALQGGMRSMKQRTFELVREKRIAFKDAYTLVKGLKHQDASLPPADAPTGGQPAFAGSLEAQ